MIKLKWMRTKSLEEIALNQLAPSPPPRAASGATEFSESPAWAAGEIVHVSLCRRLGLLALVLADGTALLVNVAEKDKYRSVWLPVTNATAVAFNAKHNLIAVGLQEYAPLALALVLARSG